MEKVSGDGGGNNYMQQSGRNLKESSGKEVEVVWACDVKSSTTQAAGRWIMEVQVREEGIQEDGWVE